MVLEFLILFMKLIKIINIPNFKSIKLSSKNDYYFITSKGIYFFNNSNNEISSKFIFNDPQILTSNEEFENISFELFSDDYFIALIKNYVYFYSIYNRQSSPKTYFFKIGINSNFSQILISDYKTNFFWHFDFYFLIVFKDSDNKLNINSYSSYYYYYFYDPKIDLIFEKKFDIYSNNFNCQLMKPNSDKEIVTCFIDNNLKELVAENFEIYNNYIIEHINSTKIEVEKYDLKIIKSLLSLNKTLSFVCYINTNNDCDCLIYNVITNEWSNYMRYLKNHSKNISSLDIIYFENRNEIFIHCFQSPIDFVLIKLNKYFEVKEKETNEIFSIDEQLIENCSEFYLSSLVYDTNNELKIFGNCDGVISKYKIKKISFPESEFFSTINTIDLPQENISMTEVTLNSTLEQNLNYDILKKMPLINDFKLEELSFKLNTLIEKIDIGKTYEIPGDDFNLIIAPTQNYNDMTNITHVNFLRCENILRKNYNMSENSIITLLQIEKINNDTKSLINEVEYQAFDENKNILNLSLCKDEPIGISYAIKNDPFINMSAISNFKENGIDLFNIKGNFFNDICFPYSEGDSDVVLKDRKKDFFLDYIICEENCVYSGFDIETKKVNCDCQIKNSLNTTRTIKMIKKEDPTVQNILKGYLEDSTFGVVKCYHLVFSLNKKENVGFWIYIIFILIHIPFIINYLIFKEDSIKICITKEMEKFHYIPKIKNPLKKKPHINKKKKIYNLNFMTTNIIDNSISNKNKKEKVTTYKNKINGDSKNNSSLRKLENKNKNSILSNKEEINKRNIRKNKTKEIKNRKENKIAQHCPFFLYNIIKVDANNIINEELIIKYNLYDNFEEAVKEERRKFLDIFFIMLILQVKIINTFFYRSPLEIQSLRIILIIFIYICNFSLNALFIFSKNISNKYHYKGNDLFIFTIVNNISISLISSLLSGIIIFILKFLTNSRKDIENIFRKEEIKLKKEKKYSVKNKTKKDLLNNIYRILKFLRIKIFIFLILEFLCILFFFYYIIAFCEVYKKTQKMWLIDCLNSFILSILIEILLAFAIAVLYKLSIYKKIKFFYTLIMFLI